MSNHPKRAVTRSLKRSDQEAKNKRNPAHAPMYEAIAKATEVENANSVSLLVSVQAELRRYALDQNYDASTIIHEAFLRSLKAIDDGKAIPYPSAWLRLTCRYIIREENRSRQAETQLDNIELLPDNSEDEDEESEVSHAALKFPNFDQAFRELSRLDQEILTLKIVKDLRWKNVQTTLISMGFGNHTLTALRQKKRRALLMLKKYRYEVT